MAPTYPDLIAKGWLDGKRVLITRPRPQAEESAKLFAQHGAIALMAPAIDIGPPPDEEAALAALSSLAQFDWVVFSSANGARGAAALLKNPPPGSPSLASQNPPPLPPSLHLQGGGGERAAVSPSLQCREGVGGWVFQEGLGGWGFQEGVEGWVFPNVAAVGPGTARALGELGIPVALVATEQLAEKLAEELSEKLESLGRPARILLPQGDIARDVLFTALTNRGHHVTRVTVYSTTTEAAPVPLAALLRDGGVDVVTFASPSAVRGALERLGEGALTLLSPCVIGSIGPVTTAEAERLGLRVDVTATEHTIDGLIQALEAWGASSRSGL